MTNLTSNRPTQRCQVPAIGTSKPMRAMRTSAAILLLCGLAQVGWAGEITVQITKRGADDPVLQGHRPDGAGFEQLGHSILPIQVFGG